MRIDRLDHLVLTVASIEASVDWYVRVLGFEHRVRDDRRSLHLGDQMIDLHRVGRTLEPKATRPTPGSGDLCFVTTTPLPEVQQHLAGEGVPVEVGPVERHGARGAMTSLYVRDPDLNLVEIAHC